MIPEFTSKNKQVRIVNSEQEHVKKRVVFIVCKNLKSKTCLVSASQPGLPHSQAPAAALQGGADQTTREPGPLPDVLLPGKK